MGGRFPTSGVTWRIRVFSFSGISSICAHPLRMMSLGISPRALLDDIPACAITS